MICRLWHGWTLRHDAAAYEQYLCEELFPRVERDVPGYVRHAILRRDAGGETAFVTLVWFRSLDDVRAFAGDDYERPVLGGRALELLVRYDDRALHYDAVA
jgi:antibiotic biosynthesis monooxygenase (ABM) superfamily enzyme